MGRLIDAALYHPEDGICDSHEMDINFNNVIGACIEKERKRREEEKRKWRVQKPLPGKPYYLEGTLNAEGMPIPLEETIRAETIEEAKEILGNKAKQYHNVEGCAISLYLFDTQNYPKTALHNVHISAKKD